MASSFVDMLNKKLIGEKIDGWRIDEYINHGKSAVVYRGLKHDQIAAIKVFDPETIDRYGRDAQRERINRERSLIGKTHSNLIDVYGGGEQGEYLFIVMEYFDGANMADALSLISPSEVRSLISQIASAAKFLERESFAHRDIKPENIGISKDMRTAKLLDFGVLRPLDQYSDITNEGDQLFFVGTLQYSPPEFLLREEEDSAEAWRAITFYQLGAVLHDLLMKKPLFEEHKNPYARLVRAVTETVPNIDNPDVDADLRLLSQNCLSKNPSYRLKVVSWRDFFQPEISDPMEAARKTIAQHRAAALQLSSASPNPTNILLSQIYKLRNIMFHTAVNTIQNESLPRYSTTENNSSTNQYLLRVVFEPSNSNPQNNWVAVYCNGSVINSTSNVYELRTWACISFNRDEIPETQKASAPNNKITGALLEQDIKEHIQKSILLAYAKAIDTVSNGMETVHWLDIEGA